MIKLSIIGHLGKDCVVNNVNGASVINFNVAHTEKYKDNAGVQNERTIWVSCAYWTEKTGIAPYLKKGTQVYAEGSPDIRTYQTQDGKQAAVISLRVFSVQLLGAKAGSDSNMAPEQVSQMAGNSYTTAHAQKTVPATPVTHNEISEPVDDLPF